MSTPSTHTDRLSDPTSGASKASPCVGDLIREMARTHPEREALRFRGESVSYRALDLMASAIAARLRARGVGPNSLVGVAIDRSIEMAAAMVGVVYSGGAYVPLDPGYPIERLQMMCEDASIHLVLSRPEEHARLAPSLPASIDYLMVDVAERADAPLPMIGTPADPIYVIFTSGSTGRPKGAINSHAGVANYLSSIQQILSSTLDDRYVLKAPCSFDGSVRELFVPLTSGACCVLAEPGRQGDGPYLVELTRSEKITVLGFVPTMLRTFLDTPGVETCRSLRQLASAGEALPLSLLERCFTTFPGIGLVNLYGPTEAAVTVAAWRCSPGEQRGVVPIGHPHPHTVLRVLDEAMRPVPDGEIGELYIGGVQVGMGYLGRPDLTAERFLADPHAPGGRLYRTGDLARRLDDGAIEWIARTDQQIKIRGFRIELSEIEAVLETHPDVAQAAVVGHSFGPDDVRLVAYVVGRGETLSMPGLRAHAAAGLLEAMVPAHWVALPSLPKLPNGKLDRKSLPAPSRNRPELQTPYREAAGAVESLCCRLFGEVLALEGLGRDDNFFELGGNSLLAVRLLERLKAEHGTAPTAAAMFAAPTPAGLARALDGTAGEDVSRRRRAASGSRRVNEPIAIVGMAGRFPNAGDVEALWRNLLDGVDGITHFTEDQIDASVPRSVVRDPSYILARGLVDGVENFDAAFFGITPREAELIDPQQRLFMEVAWECLENSGYDPQRTPGAVGVFAGVWSPSYMRFHIMANPERARAAGELQIRICNDKDHVATRVANRLDLHGPAVAIHTACSTSLVAIVQAMDSLRLGRCDMAIAGGSSVTCPPATGYTYLEGAMLSPDGRTRTFDADAQGTVFCDGVAAVMLKRLSDAQADGDQIVAIIRGGALNNDGGQKASYTAPSVDGQQAVIEMAHEDAAVDARSIGYVEAHGTATPLGDPVEVEALTRAFRRSTADTGFCKLGSIKSHIGHTVAAAGAAGVIKTALALARERIPGTLHFEQANPRIDFASSPFVVTGEATAWPRVEGVARRAGVSSFGVGGTNAHVVMEEPPLAVPTPAGSGEARLLKLSARSEAALARMTGRLADHFERHLSEHPQADGHLHDAAFTLDAGRARFTHRAAVSAASLQEAIDALRQADHAQRSQARVSTAAPIVGLMFPGQGTQYVGMGLGLYARHDVFKAAFDECADAVQAEAGFDLREAVFRGTPQTLSETRLTQPALFALEYALARLWLSRGLAPSFLIGHSVGEFVAAALAGVMKPADAAGLVAHRGALMQAQPTGSMLSVRAAAGAIARDLPASLNIAADNGPSLCVVAGPTDAVLAFAAVLEGKGIVSRLLQTSHAFHSAMMDEAVEPFARRVRQVSLSAPKIRILSTLTGRVLTDAEAQSPEYWARHLRATVDFSGAVRTALQDRGTVFVECGPRASLSVLVRQHASQMKAETSVCASLDDAPESEDARFAAALGHLWVRGIELVAHPELAARRVPLPTYPFEPKRHWLAAPAAAQDAPAAVPAASSAASLSPAPADITSFPAAAVPAPAERVVAPTASSAPANRPTSNPTEEPSPMSTPSPRHKQLAVLIEDVSGIDLLEGEPSSSFIELGLDSLSLTQVATQLKNSIGLDVSFRQLMSNFRSLDALARHADTVLPPLAVAAAASAAAAPAAVPAAAVSVGAAVPAVAALPVPTPVTSLPAAQAVFSTVRPLPMGAAASGSSDLYELIRQQMLVMSQQLAVLAPAGNWVAQPVADTAMQAAASVPSPEVVTAAAPVAAVAAPVAAVAAPATSEPAPESAEAASSRLLIEKPFGASARIALSDDHELTAEQRRWLTDFIARYNARTGRSKSFSQQNRKLMADPRVVTGFNLAWKDLVYPIVADRSKGARVWDIDGNEYIDLLSCFGANLLGYQPDFIAEAMKEQIDRGMEVGPQHPLTAEVARLISEITGMERVGFCNTGSEAVMAAMRCARTVTGRKTIAIFTNSYHGIFDEVVVRGTKKLRSISAAPGILANAVENILVLDYGTDESLRILRERGPELAAIMLETVQNRMPTLQPRDFIRETRRIADEAGCALIFDEVITGFRVAPGGAQEFYGVRADIATYGKIIGGGLPFAAVAGSSKWIDALDGGHWQYGDDSRPEAGVTYFAGTFVRHPLALAAAKATLVYLKAQGPALYKRINDRTQQLVDRLNSAFAVRGAPVKAIHCASAWRLVWNEDQRNVSLFYYLARFHGLHMYEQFGHFVTEAMGDAEIERIFQTYTEALDELMALGLITPAGGTAVEPSPQKLPPKPVIERLNRYDASKPPMAGARLGKTPDGSPAWFVPNPKAPGKYMKVEG